MQCKLINTECLMFYSNYQYSLTFQSISTTVSMHIYNIKTPLPKSAFIITLFITMLKLIMYLTTMLSFSRAFYI